MGNASSSATASVSDSVLQYLRRLCYPSQFMPSFVNAKANAGGAGANTQNLANVAPDPEGARLVQRFAKNVLARWAREVLGRKPLHRPFLVSLMELCIGAVRKHALVDVELYEYFQIFGVLNPAAFLRRFNLYTLLYLNSTD